MSRTTLARQARRAADPAVQRRARVITEDALTVLPVDSTLSDALYLLGLLLATLACCAIVFVAAFGIGALLFELAGRPIL